MTQVVPFSAVAKTPEEQRINMLFRRVLSQRREAGFECVHVPNIRYVPDKGEESLFDSKVRYDGERKTIMFCLRAIRGRKTPLTQTDLLNNPGLGKALVLSSEIEEAFKPTTDSELTLLIARAFAEHLVQVLVQYEYPDSWLVKASKPHEALAVGMVRGGIIEYMSRISAPSSEVISDEIWVTYDEDQALSKRGRARDWFESRGGHNIVAPILDGYKMRGLQYLLEHPLQVDRHFSLLQVPVYRAQALRELSTEMA